MDSTFFTSVNGTALQLGLAAGVLLLLRSYAARRNSDLPPGPTGLPVIGNIFDMPTKWPWLSFSAWKETYGSLIHLNMLGKHILVINSEKVARELLDNRSLIYSDRPKMEMISLAGYDQAMVLLPYGEEWRQQRKLVVQDIMPASCPRYYDLQEKETRALVHNMIQDSSAYLDEIKLRFGIIIVRTTYGYDVKSLEDPILQNGLQTIHDGSIAAEPGRFLVDVIPWLKHLPSWMPGTGFLELGKKWRKTFDDTCWKPLEFCKDNLHTGNMHMPNLCGNVYQEAGWNLSPDVERQLALALGTVLAAGLDSSISTAATFLMFMVLKPEIQKNAQAELDRVVGRDRLPSIIDRPDLPYIRSILTEAFRFAPPFPLSIPHTSTRDDIYEGMLIPKGSLILPNVWHMLHDPEIYKKPMEFLPERYNGQDSEMTKVKDVVFGFGRRVCPGNHFAEGTLFSFIVTILSTCEVLPGLDENGKEQMPDPMAYTSTTISFPEAFPVRLRPRSAQAATLLSETLEGSE